MVGWLFKTANQNTFNVGPIYTGKLPMLRVRLAKEQCGWDNLI